jgi:aubergine-like protein
MAQAKKKVIDESLKLQLNSDLEIACAGFSSSTSSANGKFTMSFVGTTNKDQSEIYTHCRYGMRRKDYLPDLEFELIFNYWLKTYYDKSVKIVDGAEKHFMPSVLVIYREGLSEDQLKKQIFREVRILKKVIREKVPKSLRYDPEIIYITVNKRVSTRFFDNSTKDARNANEGSVIFDEFARNNTMDFHLISQHVENADGTATPTQYRIVYRNRFELSEAALAQFTYEQCHNYYNWNGSIRIPAVLQCAGKLSKLVGEKVRENVFKIGGKKKREEKKDQGFKFLDQSSVSSIGQ